MADCGACTHHHLQWAGMFEYEGEFLDTHKSVCRRYPPQVSFWGSSYPSASTRCGEFTAPQEQSDE